VDLFTPSILLLGSEFRALLILPFLSLLMLCRKKREIGPGGLMKAVLRPGEGSKHPKEGDQVSTGGLDFARKSPQFPKRTTPPL
jgi:hypothetical protein